MSADTVINLIALTVAIITLVILSVRLGMQIKPNDSNLTKKTAISLPNVSSHFS